MNPSPDCPVCAASRWTTIGERTYTPTLAAAQNAYVPRRLRVLFELWHPDAAAVTLRSILCEQCGFVAYSPRPSESDIDDKYRFLAGLTSDEHSSHESERETARADRLWKKFQRRLPGRSARILDFGGGDGRLMTPFAAHGHACHVVDYNTRTVPGVTRLGSTLDEIDPHERFDVIVCSHVIEHVAEPFAVLSRLYAHLTDGGVIYVEVPMEIWGKAPLHAEPVTHVNFFTAESTAILLRRVGLCDVSARLEGYDHPSGHRAVVVSAFGKRVPGRVEPVDYRGAAEATRALLSPNLATRVRRAMLSPGRIPSRLLGRLRQAAAGMW